MHGKCIALFSLILHRNEIQHNMLFTFLGASQSLCCYVLFTEPLTDRQIQKHSAHQPMFKEDGVVLVLNVGILLLLLHGIFPGSAE